MANLNLSEFTEKLFVTDADHTFIWDTVGAISKRVSRNSWLNSGTLTSDAPVTISQTWNAVGQTFTALKVNAAGTSGTNSAAGSLLADFQVGGVTQFSVSKSGALTALGSALLGSLTVGSGILLSVSGGHIRASNGNAINLGAADSTSTDNFANLFLRSSAIVSFGGNTKIQRDDADNTLALRNGAAAQTFNVYGTYTSITDYKRLSLSCSATTGNATIGVPFNSVLAVTGGSSPSTTATITFATQAAAFPVGSSVVVAGVTPSGYNGTYVVTASTTSSVSYTVGGALAAWSSGGTATVSGSAALTFTGRGHLGIGTTNPTSNLEISGNIDQTVLKITSFSPGTGSNLIFNGAFGQLNNNAGSFFITNESASDPVIFRAGGQVERMRITSAGNVGIGTTSPTSKLQVTGGDVEIETVTSGIIMKAAGTSTRYRITLNAGGTALVFTAI